MSHSLVNYHFGSLDGLLAEAFGVMLAPHQVLAAAQDEAGRVDPERLVAGLLAVWEHPQIGENLRRRLLTILADPVRLRIFRGYLERSILDRLVDSLGIAAAQRAVIVIVGTILTRYVIGVPLISRLDDAVLSRQLIAMIKPPSSPASTGIRRHGPP